MNRDGLSIRYADRPPRTADVVIVGGGVVGAATAFFAARAGLRAVVLEARPRLATLTTPVSTGAFRLQFDTPEEYELVREGVDLFDAWEASTGLAGWDLGLRHGGYLFCATTDENAARARRLVERQRGWGLRDVELLPGDEARARFPYLSDGVIQARYRAADGWLDPTRLALGYAAAASAAERIPGRVPGGHATFVPSAAVTGFDGPSEGQRLKSVITARGRVSAPHVVIAAGPFTGVVAAMAGIRVEILPTRRHKLLLPSAPEVPPDAPMTIEDETAAHWRPHAGGAFGLWTDPRVEPEPALEDVPTRSGWAFALLDPTSPAGLARVAPFWRQIWERGASWVLQAGQYEYTPDHLPYLGPTAIEGLHLNGGYSGHGVMASAGGSRLVIDRLLGRPHPVAAAFAPDRPFRRREQDVL